MSKFDDVSKTIESNDLFKSMENSNRVQFIALCVDVFKLGEKSKQAEIDELRKRIEKTEKWVESNKRNIPLSEWHGYTTEEYVDADDLLDILKGK